MTIGIIFYSPSFESCKGEIIQFNDLELCLTSPDDHLTYRAAQIRDYINHNNYKPIDSLEKKAIKQYFLFNSGKRTVAEVGKVQQAEYSVGSIIPFFKNDTSILHFYQNLAVDFYNHGVPSYNRFDSLGKSVDEYYQISGDSIKFCAAFEEAKFYDNKIERRGVSAEVENILKMQCSIQNNAQNLPLENNKKVKPNTIGGKVYDKENSNVRLSGVEVDIADLSNNIITNQRGRYELQLPETLLKIHF